MSLGNIAVAASPPPVEARWDHRRDWPEDSIGHLMEPLLVTADVGGEVLGTPSPKMRLGEGGPNLFTPWQVFQHHASGAK